MATPTKVLYMMTEKWTYSLKITYWETTRLSPLPWQPTNPVQSIKRKKTKTKINYIKQASED